MYIHDKANMNMAENQHSSICRLVTDAPPPTGPLATADGPLPSQPGALPGRRRCSQVELDSRVIDSVRSDAGLSAPAMGCPVAVEGGRGLGLVVADGDEGVGAAGVAVGVGVVTRAVDVVEGGAPAARAHVGHGILSVVDEEGADDGEVDAQLPWSVGMRRIWRDNGTDGSEAELEAAADEGRHGAPDVAGYGREFGGGVGIVDAQGGCDVDDDAAEEEGGHAHAPAERHLQLKDDKGGQDGAEEVGEGVDDAVDGKEDVDVEAAVGVGRMGIPECLERTIRGKRGGEGGLAYCHSPTECDTYWQETQAKMTKRT